LEIMVQCEIITAAEAEKRSLPGVERAIPKNKGFEFGSLLHQFAVEFHQNPKNADVLAVFKEMGVTPKAKEVEKSPPKKETRKAEVASPASGKTKSDTVTVKPDTSAAAKKADKPAVPAKVSMDKGNATKAVESKKKVEAKVDETKKPEPKKTEAKKTEPTKPEIKKTEVKKPDVKKPDIKKPEAKTLSSKVDTKPSEKKQGAKPAAKAPDKKDAEPVKASKPAQAAKKSVPSKKPAETKDTPTKKKPR